MMKKILYAAIAAISLNSCTCEEPHVRATNPGYVAFDYSYSVVKEYITAFDYIYRFNEYYKQPTAEKRDSVDRLYFNNIKISRDADVWTLRHIGGYYQLTINTNGNDIEQNGAVWTISSDEYNGSMKFDVENTGEKHLYVASNKYSNYFFSCSTVWYFRFTENRCELSGSGSLLSFATPSLKLDYTITEPMSMYINADNHTVAAEGAFKILATDVNKQLTEETQVRILPPDKVGITYNGYSDEWPYYL